MPEENQFGIMLATLRKSKGGWTSEQTAAWLGVTRHTYSDWETGKRLPSPEKLKRIANKFELNQEDEDALYRAAAKVPPKICNLPFHNPFFTGRETHLERLGKLLQETGTAAITQSISISGLGGIGKTQLALEYAHRSYPNVYRAVLWVNAADKTALQGDYDKLAQRLELPDLNEGEQERCVEAVKQWLETHTNWLLIMDNADDLPLARSFLPSRPLGHVLFTTRSQIMGTTAIRARHIEIEAMEPEEGRLFLLLRSKVLKDETKLDKLSADIREAAHEVVELLGMHPLALDQAGAFIEGTGVSFAGYVKRYHAERQRLLSRRGSLKSKDSLHNEHPESVVTTFELSCQQAREQHPLATDILRFCAFLLPDGIPEELFQYDDSFDYDTTEFDEGIEALQSYSLIKRHRLEQTFSIHRLVQAVIIDAMFPDLQRQLKERVVQALNAAMPAVGDAFISKEGHDFEGRWRCGRLVSHVMACAAWADDEITPTVDIAELFLKAGSYLDDKYRFSEAKPLLARVLPIYEQHFGAKHLETATVLIRLADLDKGSQAEHLYQQALAILETQLGADHLETARCLHSLALLYMNQYKYDQAEQLLIQVHSFREEHFGAEHPDTIKSLHHLARLYFRQYKYEQAEALYRHGLEIREKHFGIEHHETARSLYNLAVLYFGQGKDEQSVSLFLRALKILEQSSGGYYLDTSDIVHVVAVLLRWQGKHEQADTYYHILEQQYGGPVTMTDPYDRVELCDSLALDMG